FKSLLEQYYSSLPSHGEAPELSSSGAMACRAFVESIGDLGNFCHDQCEKGNHDIIGILGAEEANLLSARHLAQAYGWWRCLVVTMQGLHALYDHTGRHAEWAALVEE